MKMWRCCGEKDSVRRVTCRNAYEEESWLEVDEVVSKESRGRKWEGSDETTLMNFNADERAVIP